VLGPNAESCCNLQCGLCPPALSLSAPEDLETPAAADHREAAAAAAAATAMPTAAATTTGMEPDEQLSCCQLSNTQEGYGACCADNGDKLFPSRCLCTGSHTTCCGDQPRLAAPAAMLTGTTTFTATADEQVRCGEDPAWFGTAPMGPKCTCLSRSPFIYCDARTRTCVAHAPAPDVHDVEYDCTAADLVRLDITHPYHHAHPAHACVVHQSTRQIFCPMAWLHWAGIVPA
jgi:hypothetical protein